MYYTARPHQEPEYCANRKNRDDSPPSGCTRRCAIVYFYLKEREEEKQAKKHTHTHTRRVQTKNEREKNISVKKMEPTEFAPFTVSSVIAGIYCFDAEIFRRHFSRNETAYL